MGLSYLFSIVSQYWLYLFVAWAAHAFYAHITYTDLIPKDSNWFLTACIVMGVIGNIMWALFVKAAKNNSDIFLMGQVWDFMPIFFFVILPPLIYDIGLTGWKLWAGILLIILGIILISYAKH